MQDVDQVMHMCSVLSLENTAMHRGHTPFYTLQGATGLTRANKPAPQHMPGDMGMGEEP